MVSGFLVESQDKGEVVTRWSITKATLRLSRLVSLTWVDAHHPRADAYGAIRRAAVPSRSLLRELPVYCFGSQVVGVQQRWHFIRLIFLSTSSSKKAPSLHV